MNIPGITLDKYIWKIEHKKIKTVAYFLSPFYIKKSIESFFNTSGFTSKFT